MRKTQIGVISLVALLILIAITFSAYADSGVNATPEVQGLITGTSANVVGTVSETDTGAMSLTHDPSGGPSITLLATDVAQWGFTPPIDPLMNQLINAGGSIDGYFDVHGNYWFDKIVIPVSLLNQPVAGDPLHTWNDYVYDSFLNPSMGYVLSSHFNTNSGGLHDGILDPGQVQYTTGYSDQYLGVSGRQTFTKSMSLSTANKIADQSNIKANTNIQYVAVDSGRATRTEDLLLDGAAQGQESANLILCPFVSNESPVIPAFCNIEQAGSAFDTTLTSTVTSADTRFIGTDSTFPVVLNYNINSEGLTVGNQSSPMIGSVSAYLKVHVQEARNESVSTDYFGHSFISGYTTQKSEDLAYSETSSASGLISKFSKNMQYQSGPNLV
jgi:hypothetical protein